jgi:hypothetical protein
MGVGLRPFAAVHVEQPWRRPRTPGDLTIRWIRRSRALAADSWTAPEVPLAEELEAYEVEIMDGATVKRTLATATTSVIYSAADQIADWGALLGPGDTSTSASSSSPPRRRARRRLLDAMVHLGRLDDRDPRPRDRARSLDPHRDRDHGCCIIRLRHRRRAREVRWLARHRRRKHQLRRHRAAGVLCAYAGPAHRQRGKLHLRGRAGGAALPDDARAAGLNDPL